MCFTLITTDLSGPQDGILRLNAGRLGRNLKGFTGLPLIFLQDCNRGASYAAGFTAVTMIVRKIKTVEYFT